MLLVQLLLPIFHLFIVFFYFVPQVNSFIEYVQNSVCENCTLRLTCRMYEFITIISADFIPEDANMTSYFDDFNAKYPPLHPRFALIKRCSGVNYCSFILSNDCPDSLKWGPGHLAVKYGCVEESRISKYCNENVTLPMAGWPGISMGVVQNPGYPRYYLGHDECKWRIRAPPMQKIKLTILDLSLIGDTSGCTDQLEIRDGDPTSAGSSLSRTIFAGCEDMDGVSKAPLLRSREILYIRIHRTTPLAKQLNYVALPQSILAKYQVAHEEIVRAVPSQRLDECTFDVAARAYQHLNISPNQHLTPIHLLRNPSIH